MRGRKRTKTERSAKLLLARDLAYWSCIRRVCREAFRKTGSSATAAIVNGGHRMTNQNAMRSASFCLSCGNDPSLPATRSRPEAEQPTLNLGTPSDGTPVRHQIGLASSINITGMSSRTG